MLFTAWLLHDLEEAFTFASTSRILAERMGTRQLVVTNRESVVAIGIVAIVVGAACARGTRRDESRLYRAVLAGLEAHVASHVAASIALRRYTAGVVTAPLVMLPGARHARALLAADGRPLSAGDTVRGSALMLGTALGAHLAARLLCRAAPRRGRRP